MLGQQTPPEALEITTFDEVSNQQSSKPIPAAPDDRKSPSRGPARLVGAAWGGFKGSIASAYNVTAAVVVLALVAAVPVLNFWVLGYLLEAQGGIARGESWRHAVPGGKSLSRIASIGLGMFLSVLPLRLLSGAASDAQLISPGSTADVGLHRLLMLLSVVVTVTICMALARGGRLIEFFRPIRNFRWTIGQMRSGEFLDTAGSDIWEFVKTLKLRERFWLGLRGFVSAFSWLLIPTALFASAQSSEGAAVLVTILGGLLLIPVLAWLPLLQANFSAENRFRAGFQLGKVRQLYRKAPLASMVAVVVTLVLSLPLYLAKVVLPPQDAMWMVTLLFILGIYPAKLIAGWAYRRAQRREREAHWSWRWLGRGVMFPLLSVYVFLLLFTQGIGEHGKLVLFQHHAFLLPVPF